MSLGKAPSLAWIDKTLLSIERSYQRTLSANRSQKLIGKLAGGFCWAHCAPLIVAPKGAGWVIIDGQHRHQAALRRDDIKDLPCYIVDARDLRDQAKAFVAHNRDRVALNSIAMFHAGVAAGEGMDVAVAEACARAGVEIPRTPISIAFMAPNQSIATGVMARIVGTDGAARLVDVLKLIRRAHPNANGQLRGRTIGAVAVIMRHDWMKPAALVKALQRLDGQALEDAARARRTAQALSLGEAFVAELLTEGGDIPPNEAIDVMRAEEKERGRAQIKAIYESNRAARAAAKAERAAKHEAEKALRAAKREADRAELRRRLDEEKAAAIAARQAERDRRRQEREESKAARADEKARRREAVKAEARKAIEGKKNRRAFRFARTNVYAGTKSAPAEIRGEVRVRRFENGSIETIALRSLQRAGVKVEQCLATGKPGGHPIDKWKVRGKIHDIHDLIRCANDVRIERGEEPLISPKRRSA